MAIVILASVLPGTLSATLLTLKPLSAVCRPLSNRHCQHEGSPWCGLRIKAAEAAALKSGKKGGSRPELERKYQAGGGHSGMSVFVDFEAGHLEIGSLIDEPAILCAQEEMF